MSTSPNEDKPHSPESSCKNESTEEQREESGNCQARPENEGKASVVEKISEAVSSLCSKLKLNRPSSHESKDEVAKILEDKTTEAVANYILSEKCRNIIVMAGAGISTSAGIPDFRSPGTGVYEKIQMKYKLLDPQIMFEINFFKKNPEPFYALTRELFPVNIKPTSSHVFIKLLHDKGYLLRHYTQNIDGLEKQAGLPQDKVVEAHGSFHTSHCLNHSCKQEYSFDWMREQIRAEKVPRCSRCDHLVKPDVIFFGENLPLNFFKYSKIDFPKCDLLIVMGTSLVVQPFASLVTRPPSSCPRVLINNEKVGIADSSRLSQIMYKIKDGAKSIHDAPSKGFDFDSETNKDVALLGECDEGVEKLVQALGWTAEFDSLKNKMS